MDEKEVIKWNEFARELRRREPLDWIRSNTPWPARWRLFPPWRERKGRALKGRLGGGRKVQQTGGVLSANRPTILSSSPRLSGGPDSMAMILADHSRETLIDFLERSREILATLTEEEKFPFFSLKVWNWPTGIRRFHSNSLSTSQDQQRNLKGSLLLLVRRRTYPHSSKHSRGHGLFRPGIQAVPGPGREEPFSVSLEEVSAP